MDSREPSKYLKVEKNMPTEAKKKIKCLLHDNLDIFAWKHKDMFSIDLKVSYHHLKIEPKAIPYRQKKRTLNPERYEALKDEVKKLIGNRFIRELIYPKWVSNVNLSRNTMESGGYT